MIKPDKISILNLILFILNKDILLTTIFLCLIKNSIRVSHLVGTVGAPSTR